MDSSLKQSATKINNKFTKGINNIFSSTLINLFILLSLIIILAIIYLKNNKIDLFGCPDPSDSTCTTIGNPITTKYIDNGYIQKMINTYNKKIVDKTKYQDILNIQEKTIQTLAQQINDTLNPN